MSLEAISLRLLAQGIRVAFSRRPVEAPEHPQSFGPERGEKAINLKRQCRALTLKEKFDGRDWNRFCSNMIGLLGGEQTNTTTRRSNFFPGSDRESKIMVFRLKGEDHNRGVIYLLPKDAEIVNEVGLFSKPSIESVFFGCDSNVSLAPKEVEHAQATASRVFRAYNLSQSSPLTASIGSPPFEHLF